MEIIDAKTHALLVNREAGHIRYVSYNTETVDWYSYHDDLLAVLQKVYTDADKRTGRTRFTYAEGRAKHHIRCHDLALGVYTGRIHADSFLTDWKEFVRWKNENNLNIDHIDGHGENNTRWNLSLMDARTNRIKHDIISRVRLPNALNAVYVNGQYRVKFSTYEKSDGTERAAYFLCNDAEEFVKRLRWIINNQFRGVPPIKDKAGRWLQADGEWVYGDICYSVYTQETLGGMDKDDFLTLVNNSRYVSAHGERWKHKIFKLISERA